MSAQSDALGVSEILHLILASLPMECLLTSASLVCRRWHDTIQTSPIIQQQLFFQPRPATQEPYLELNPLLMKVFPLFFQAHYFPALGCNPEAVFDDLPVSCRTDAFMRQGASWRKMLVLQPPILSLGIMSARFHSSTAGEWMDCYKSRRGFEDEGGLRMGKLYDQIYSWLGTEAHLCQLSWQHDFYSDTKGGPLERSPNSAYSGMLNCPEHQDAVQSMLKDVRMVLQLVTFRPTPMTSWNPILEWKEKFRSEEFTEVGTKVN